MPRTQKTKKETLHNKPQEGSAVELVEFASEPPQQTETSLVTTRVVDTTYTYTPQDMNLFLKNIIMHHHYGYQENSSFILQAQDGTQFTDHTLNKKLFVALSRACLIDEHTNLANFLLKKHDTETDHILSELLTIMLKKRQDTGTASPIYGKILVPLYAGKTCAAIEILLSLHNRLNVSYLILSPSEKKSSKSLFSSTLGDLKATFETLLGHTEITSTQVSESSLQNYLSKRGESLNITDTDAPVIVLEEILTRSLCGSKSSHDHQAVKKLRLLHLERLSQVPDKNKQSAILKLIDRITIPEKVLGVPFHRTSPKKHTMLALGGQEKISKTHSLLSQCLFEAVREGDTDVVRAMLPNKELASLTSQLPMTVFHYINAIQKKVMAQQTCLGHALRVSLLTKQAQQPNRLYDIAHLNALIDFYLPPSIIQNRKNLLCTVLPANQYTQTSDIISAYTEGLSWHANNPFYFLRPTLCDNRWVLFCFEITKEAEGHFYYIDPTGAEYDKALLQQPFAGSIIEKFTVIETLTHQQKATLTDSGVWVVEALGLLAKGLSGALTALNSIDNLDEKRKEQARYPTFSPAHLPKIPPQPDLKKLPQQLVDIKKPLLDAVKPDLQTVRQTIAKIASTLPPQLLKELAALENLLEDHIGRENEAFLLEIDAAEHLKSLYASHKTSMIQDTAALEQTKQHLADCNAKLNTHTARLQELSIAQCTQIEKLAKDDKLPNTLSQDILHCEENKKQRLLQTYFLPLSLQHPQTRESLLHYAVRYKQFGVARILLEKGMDYFILDGNNRHILDIYFSQRQHKHITTDDMAIYRLLAQLTLPQLLEPCANHENLSDTFRRYPSLFQPMTQFFEALKSYIIKVNERVNRSDSYYDSKHRLIHLARVLFLLYSFWKESKEPHELTHATDALLQSAPKGFFRTRGSRLLSALTKFIEESKSQSETALVDWQNYQAASNDNQHYFFFLAAPVEKSSKIEVALIESMEEEYSRQMTVREKRIKVLQSHLHDQEKRNDRLERELNAFKEKFSKAQSDSQKERDAIKEQITALKQQGVTTTHTDKKCVDMSQVRSHEGYQALKKKTLQHKIADVVIGKINSLAPIPLSVTDLLQMYEKLITSLAKQKYSALLQKAESDPGFRGRFASAIVHEVVSGDMAISSGDKQLKGGALLIAMQKVLASSEVLVNTNESTPSP